MNTSEEREQAFILLFEKSFNTDLAAADIYDIAVSEEVIKESNFTKELFFITDNNLEEIDSVIGK